MSTITIPRKVLKRIEERSVYNHNYYELPFSIDKSNIIYGVNDDDCTTLWYLIGEENKKIYIGISDLRFDHDSIDMDIEITSEFPS